MLDPDLAHKTKRIKNQYANPLTYNSRSSRRKAKKYLKK